MRRLTDATGSARTAAAFLLVLALAGVGAASRAALAPRVKNPHGAFKEDCALCHGADAWKPARISTRFNHAKYGFALEGAHAAAGCASCHASLDFAQDQARCASCHQDPHRGEMGDDCGRCHGSRSFIDRGGMLKAHQLTHFPLTGGHASLECESCHRPAAQGQLQFVGARAECQACHMADYNAAPNHVAGSFPLQCATCHTTFGWSRARFDHAQTGFPLTGSHRALACASCHGTSDFSRARAECVSCHRGDYDGTTDPNHAAAGYSTACQTCHNTSGWGGATFDHSTTRFPLTGAHTGAACGSCHGDGVFAGKSTECVSCHRANYDGTTDPNHAAAGYSTTCQTCHNTSGWGGATFDHNTTAFPLTGAHTGAACGSCHGDGVYAGKSTECVSCHRANYDGTTNPNHTAAGYSTDCRACHNTSGWGGSAFDHNTTSFPLTGAHTSAACSSCHGDGVYAGKSTECVSCHRANYDGTSDPNHSAAGFELDCRSCHGTSSWSGATFDQHDTNYFPIYSGVHDGRWSNCSTCHTTAASYSAFTCFSCHPHDDKAGTDGHHSGVSGYRYDSQACYSCHPQGRR